MKIKTNIENLENYKKYLSILKATCEFLDKKGYLKIDLPILSPALIPESYLEVFQTDFIYLDKKEKLYLTPSPELFLKRLLAYGVGNCYYLGKSFRNSDLPSSFHSPEFTMLEIYKMGVSYLDLADEILAMLRFIKSKVKNLNLKVSFDRWEKLTVEQAFEKYAGISKKELFDHQLFISRAKKKGYQVEGFSYEDIWSQIYTQEIEMNLGKNGYPTLLYDYPKEFAALAKLNADQKTAQRFEFYIDGVELGDCYSELTDWKEQEKRFYQEQNLRKKLKKIIHPIDKGFIQALKYGLETCSGVAIGFERLAMIFIGVKSIEKLKLININ